jgi:hypothetical protein
MDEKKKLDEPVNGYKEMRVRYTLRNEVDPALAALDRAVSMLPKVDANGYSECPYAAQIYRQKDEAAAKVGKVLEHVRNLLTTVEKEVARCRKRLAYLEEHVDEIHDPRTKDGYGSAASEVQRDLAVASEDRRLLKNAIESMERARKHAAKLTHPGSNQQSSPERKGEDHSRPVVAAPRPSIPTAGRGIISIDAQR